VLTFSMTIDDYVILALSIIVLIETAYLWWLPSYYDDPAGISKSTQLSYIALRQECARLRNDLDQLRPKRDLRGRFV
jgi:hypothetical protein